jgi:glycosyltransferase involved in cell wall biosynthesis
VPDAPRPIIVVGPTPPPLHGVSVMTVQLIRALRDQGLLAAHLDTRDRRDLSNIGRLDVQNVWLAARHGARFARLLARHRDAPVYVPVSQNRLGFLRDAMFLLMARAARRRRYVHLHGGYFDSFYRSTDPLTRRVVRAALGGAEQAWVLTPGLRPTFTDLIAPDRVRVLGNVVDDPGPAAVNGNGNGHGPTARLRVLYLSTLMAPKGCFELVEALRAMGESARGLHVRIVGEGSPEVVSRLREHGRRLAGRGVRIDLPGPLDGAEKAREYLDADVFVFPSYYAFEGQPLVLLEAMAAGLPIVATTLGGIPETIRDEREALLVAPNDSQAFGRALERLAGDAELRARLGAAARRRFEEHHTSDRYADELRALLAAAGS